MLFRRNFGPIAANMATLRAVTVKYFVIAAFKSVN